MIDINKKLTLMCPINTLGYGVASLNILKELYKMLNVNLSLIGDRVEVNTKEDMQIVSDCIQRNRKLDFDAPCVKIFHQDRMDTFAGKGDRIGFPFFELDTFNSIEKHHLNSLDKIFVASKWAKNICLENNLTVEEDNIIVIPLGVDSKLFKPQTLPSQQEKTIFFNCGKWEVRKGHDIIPEIFNKAFSQSDDVELWMMNSNPFLTEEETKAWQRKYIDTPLGSKVRFIPRVQTQQEVYNIMCNVDCGIFPSRAEGWNLELLEMMSCGKHVITTNYSAHTEFCDKENSLLVNIKGLEKAEDGKWFHGQGKWAKIDTDEINQFVEHMQKVHADKQNKKLSINEAGISTSHKFTWSKTCAEILSNVR